jgi:hypothetical protein
MIAFDFPIFMLTAVDTKTCDRCGTPFVRSRRQGPRVWLRRRYCSQRCSSRAGAARDAQRLRDEAGCYNCLVCSKQLGGFQTKFCSNACANEHNNGGEQPPPNVCRGRRSARADRRASQERRGERVPEAIPQPPGAGVVEVVAGELKGSRR